MHSHSRRLRCLQGRIACCPLHMTLLVQGVMSLRTFTTVSPSYDLPGPHFSP